MILRALIQQYEINRLVKEAKQLSLDPYSLVMLRALAGIAGKLDSEALRQLIQDSETPPLDCRLPQLPQLKQTSLWLGGGIHAVQPDLLAADLLHPLADDRGTTLTIAAGPAGVIGDADRLHQIAPRSFTGSSPEGQRSHPAGCPPNHRDGTR